MKQTEKQRKYQRAYYEKLRNDPARKARLYQRDAEYRKQRREDPGYLEQRRELQREWYKRVKADPVAIERRRLQRRGYYERIRANPDRVEKSRRESRERYQRICADPVTREKEMQTRNAYKAKVLNDPVRRRRMLDSMLKHNRKKQGIDHAAAEAMLAKADCCAICGAPPSGKMFGGLQPDHDHETKMLRGALCPYCNKGLGAFKDNPDLLRKAADYLDAARRAWLAARLQQVE
jgi:hypothetical protein